MATFKPVVQKIRADKTYLVYIRVTDQHRKSGYIKTDMYVFQTKVKDGEITDSDVLGKCWEKIREYNRKLNLENNTEKWSVKEIIDYITLDKKGISFTDFCTEYIDKLVNEDRGTTAIGYKAAVTSFKSHFGENVDFQDMNSYNIGEWIDTLKNTKRAKENYPKAIKAIFVAGRKKFNNQQKGIIKIANQPFDDVEIPKHDLPRRRAINASTIKAICESNPKIEQAQKARDVAKLMVYLVGINTVDIFKMRKSDVVDGKLRYERSKTRGKRRDKAYIEVGIRPEIEELMLKYNNGDKIWDFGYRDERAFNKYMNEGLKKICTELNLPPVDTYTFRHSWATIAYNKCGISMDTIAFCLNHRSAHIVTAGYIDKDFSAIDRANEIVTDYIFKQKHDDNDEILDLVGGQVGE